MESVLGYQVAAYKRTNDVVKWGSEGGIMLDVFERHNLSESIFYCFKYLCHTRAYACVCCEVGMIHKRTAD